MNALQRQEVINNGFQRACEEVRKKHYGAFPDCDETLIGDQMAVLQPSTHKDAAQLIIDMSGPADLEMSAELKAKYAERAFKYFEALASAYSHQADLYAQENGYYDEAAA